jgi:hypothetical protein
MQQWLPSHEFRLMEFGGFAGIWPRDMVDRSPDRIIKNEEI